MKNTPFLPLLIFSFFIFINNNSFSQPVPYIWNNVAIGGGGYITGFQIHPSDPDIRYYRTDIGGAYKWDSTLGEMRPIIFTTNDNHYSVAGIALDAADPAVVILAVDRKCDAANTAIYKSADYGESFTVVEGFPFYFAANGGRNCSGSDKDRQGTPIAINPLNTNELYIGTRDSGLYKMNLTTNVTTKLGAATIPNNTMAEHYSIRSVVFHPVQKQYVFIGYANYGVFMGNTNTGVYSLLGDVAVYSDLQYAIDLSVSKDGDYLMVACKKEGIWKCDDPLGAATWTETVGNNTKGEGYLTVSCSPHDNGTVVTCVGGWNSINLGELEYSTDSGSNWNFRAGTIGTNIHPWFTDSFGARISQLRFDPVNDKRLFYTDWFSTLHTDDWTAATAVWTNEWSKGHEEMGITDISAFPTNGAGNFILYNCADQIGFMDDDLTTYPTDQLKALINDTNTTNKGASSDFCESNPDHLVVCATFEWDSIPGIIATSADGGLSFTRQLGYDETLGKAVVALSSGDPDNIVLVQKNNVQYTLDGGANFTNATGAATLTPTCANTGAFTCLGASNLSGLNLNTSVFSSFRMIEGDKVLPCVFYFYDWDDGSFHVSTDGGQNWCMVNNTDLPDFGGDPWGQHSRLTAVPGHARHLWLNFNNSLYRSTDGGQSWSQLANIDKAVSFATGKAAPNASYPSLFIYGSTTATADDFYFRSDDEGATWIQINDHAENEKWKAPKVIEGDRNVHGRIYASISGLGLLYADIDSSALCDETNLLVNESFESGYSNWSTHANNTGDADFEISTTTSVSGSQCAKVTVNLLGTNFWDIQIKQSPIEVTASKTYKVGLWAKADQPNLEVTFASNTVGGNNFVFTKNGFLTTDWQYLSTTFTPATSDDIYFVFNMGHNEGTYYVDQFLMQEGCTNGTCTNDVMYVPFQPIPTGLYETTCTIESNGYVPPVHYVLLKAAEGVTLQPGFHADGDLEVGND